MGPVPALASDRDANSRQAVNCGEGEALRLTVVLTQAAEDADVLRKLLLRVDAEAVLERSIPVGTDD